MSLSKPQAIGIDLGTTYSCVARVMSDTVVEVIKNHYGNKITPSVVHFGKTGKEVGEEAQALRAADPINTIFQIKRFMGRDFNDDEIKKHPYPFEIVPTAKGDAAIRVKPIDGESRIYRPEEISGIILKYMAVLAAKHMGVETGAKMDAVITVPANFDNTQRQATKDAGELAGLNVLRIINEPTAAALAYGFGTNLDKKRIVLVYDLGGGTFDVSIVRCQKLGGKVLSTEGLTSLGGEDFDQRIYQYACAEFKDRGFDIAPEEEFGLRKSCEAAKVTLSTRDRANIQLFKNGTSKSCEITRAAFEELCVDLFEKTITCLENAISAAGVDKESIDDILLVGGSSRIPRVQQLVREFFGNRELKFNIPPDHAVACGRECEEDPGAISEQHSSLRGAVRLADVLPFSLGTNVSYDRCSRILEKNEPYPVSNTRSYSNGEDNHTEMVFMILEGESARHSENKLLGVCTIPIPQKKIGENVVLGTYSVDENGILSVHLRDLDTAEQKSIQVQTSRLSEEERMMMMRNAILEEENEQIERAKFDARSSFADAMTKVKTSVHKTDSTRKKIELLTLVESEEKWIESTNPSNEDLIARASIIKKNLAEIMKP